MLARTTAACPVHSRCVAQLLTDEGHSGGMKLPQEYDILLTYIPVNRHIVAVTHYADEPVRGPEVARTPEPADAPSQVPEAEVKPTRRHFWRRRG